MSFFILYEATWRFLSSVRVDQTYARRRLSILLACAFLVLIFQMYLSEEQHQAGMTAGEREICWGAMRLGESWELMKVDESWRCFYWSWWNIKEYIRDLLEPSSHGETHVQFGWQFFGCPAEGHGWMDSRIMLDSWILYDSWMNDSIWKL